LPLGDPHGWYPDDVARHEPIQLIDATFVDAHFAGAEDAVNMAFWDTLADAQQVIVDALTCFFLGDCDKLGGSR